MFLNFTLCYYDYGIKFEKYRKNITFFIFSYFITQFQIIPQGMSLILKWIDETYNHPEIMISENGYPEPDEFDFSMKKLEYHHVRTKSYNK